MSWIKKISFLDATGSLKKIYDRVVGPGNNVDNVLEIHSLRPHTLEGHMHLYKSVLHHHNNTLPKWYLESLGVYVSHLNQCHYCVAHHSVGLKKLLQEDHEKYDKVFSALTRNRPEEAFEGKLLEGILYAKKLTFSHHWMTQKDVLILQEAGFDDGEILEINQVVSYFNYVNRSVIGLGVNTEGDNLGLSPNDSSNPQDWRHT